jgi:hypothetical protein
VVEGAIGKYYGKFKQTVGIDVWKQAGHGILQISGFCTRQRRA